MDVRCCACRREPTAARSFACERRACLRCASPAKRGDLYVELQVVVPKPIDERVRNLLRELASLEPENPRQDIFARAGA